ADLAATRAGVLFENHEMFAIRISAFDCRKADICAGRIANRALCHGRRPPIKPSRQAGSRRTRMLILRQILAFFKTTDGVEFSRRQLTASGQCPKNIACNNKGGGWVANAKGYCERRFWDRLVCSPFF